MSVSKKWPTVALGDACDVVNGTTPDSKNARYWGAGIVWITPADLGRLSDRHILQSARTLTQSGFESCGLSLVPAGSVILSSRAPIGYLGIAGVPLCFNQGCKALVPRRGLDSLYLYFVLRSAIPALQALGSGATFAEISKSIVSEFAIPLPPLPEQKRIAAELDAQMALVERARAAAEKRLADLANASASILRAAFSDEATADWPSVALGDAAKSVRGVGFAKQDARYSSAPDLVPVLRAGNISDRLNLDTDLVWVPAKYVSEDQQLRVGDLVICMSSGSASVVGKSAILSSEWRGSFGAFLGVLRPTESIDPRYLANLMQSPVFLDWRDSQARGANIQNLRMSSLEELEVPLPPLIDQGRIAAELDARMAHVERARAAAEAELRAISLLPAALLREVFGDETNHG